jgi:putative phosphoribosyl transferase
VQQAEVALPRKLSTRKGKQGSEVQPKRRPVLENANGNETLETKLPLSRVVVRLSKDGPLALTFCCHGRVGHFMYVNPLFRDRNEAGQVLGQRLKSVVRDSNVIVLALPRGGVPVGFEVAKALHSDLDILLVRKLGVPGHEELAIGAIASGAVRVLNQALIEELGITSSVIDQITAQERRKIKRRERLYREDRPSIAVGGRAVILVDDGLATGATMLAAAHALQIQGPRRIIVAVPVASHEACEEFRRYVDQIVCAERPEPFCAVIGLDNI